MTHPHGVLALRARRPARTATGRPKPQATPRAAGYQGNPSSRMVWGGDGVGGVGYCADGEGSGVGWGGLLRGLGGILRGLGGLWRGWGGFRRGLGGLWRGWGGFRRGWGGFRRGCGWRWGGFSMVTVYCVHVIRRGVLQLCVPVQIVYSFCVHFFSLLLAYVRKK